MDKNMQQPYTAPAQIPAEMPMEMPMQTQPMNMTCPYAHMCPYANTCPYMNMQQGMPQTMPEQEMPGMADDTNPQYGNEMRSPYYYDHDDHSEDYYQYGHHYPYPYYWRPRPYYRPRPWWWY